MVAVVGAAIAVLCSVCPAFAWTVSSDGVRVNVSRSADDSAALSAVRVYDSFGGSGVFDAAVHADSPESYGSFREFAPVVAVSSFECTVDAGVHLVEVLSNGQSSFAVVQAAPVRVGMDSGLSVAPVSVEGTLPVVLAQVGGVSSKWLDVLVGIGCVGAGVGLGRWARGHEW